MSYLSFSPRAIRQFITLFLIYSLVLNLPVIAAARRIAGNNATTISTSNSVAPVTPAAPVMAMVTGDITQIGSPGASVGFQTTTSYTLAAGNNRALIVTVAAAESTDITGVSFNGQALTRVAQAADNFELVVNSVWVRAMGAATSSTTGTITIIRNGGSCEAGIFAVAYENVDQTTPMNGAQSLVQPFTGNTYTSSSLTISSKPGDLVFDAVYGFNTIPLTAGSGQTVVHSSSSSIDACYDSQLRTSVKAGAASVGMSWSATAQFSLHVGANINKAVLVPSITSATYDASSGVLGVTAVDVTTGDTIDTSTLTLTGEGGSTYTLTSSSVTASSATAFAVTLNATDRAAVNQIFNKNGTSSTSATTYNLAAAANWDSTASAAADLTGNGITVSNIQIPTITSATYDSTTGVLAVTGTGFLKLSGATNDIDVSKLSISGDATAYSLTSSSVEITNSTSFSVTLNATDKTALQTRLNKNGTSSVGAVTYNLAAAEDWAAGADPAVVLADLTGNGISVSNAAAAPTLGNYSTATVIAGNSTTPTPSAAPTGTTSATAYTSSDFKGVFSVDPTTGVVRVTNAQPAGTYTVNVVAFGAGGTATKTFTLTVNNPSACTTTGFSGTTDVAVSSPVSVTTGDFNGDGKLDFAAANSSSRSVSIRLGDGLGGFSGTTNVAVGSSPLSVTTGDFNGDGKLDFAAANSSSNTVSIRLGDGLGGFSGTTNVSVGRNPNSVTTGDFNGDGKLDFAATNWDSGTVSIRLGDGLGGFSGTTEIAVGSIPQFVTTGDFNGDGKLDFAAASNGISIRLGDGAGNFSVATDVAVGSFPYSVTTGDFNGDGKLDFAAASNGISIRLGDGAGNFSVATDVAVGSSLTP